MKFWSTINAENAIKQSSQRYQTRTAGSGSTHLTSLIPKRRIINRIQKTHDCVLIIAFQFDSKKSGKVKKATLK